MCTLALYFQEFKDYPLIVAANRDEYLTRPSLDPQILVESPLVFGGKDQVAGGTWLGVNEHGMLVGVVNRRSAKEAEHTTVRSRGLLCLDVLKAKNPAQACMLLKRQNGSDYQPFNLLFATTEEAYVAYNGAAGIQHMKLEKGVRVLSNASVYDSSSEKLNQAYDLFSDAAKQVHKDVDVSFLKRLFRRGIPVWDQPSFIRLLKGILGNHMMRKGSRDPKDAICVHTKDYGTVSSTIIFYAREEKRFHYYHASIPPCRGEYHKFLSIDVL